MLLLLACADPKAAPTAPTAPVDLVATLGAPGPYAVGYRESALTYADAIGGDDRTLRLAVWYPSSDASGTDALYDGFFPAPGVWADATPAAGPFPLAVFSHGHQGYAENSGFLLAHLASHGYVVYAPDHTGNTTFDGSDRDSAIYAQRPRDLSAVLDHALDLPDDDPLAGRISGSVTDGPVLGLGHSFGGYTMFALAGAAYDPATLDACAAGTGPDPFCSTMTEALADVFLGGLGDARIGAIVAMAPGDGDLFGADGLGAIDIPVLHMTATLDQGPGSEGDTIWAGLQGGDARRVQLIGGEHASFTDLATGLADATISAEEAWRIVDVYGLAWGLALGGDTSVRPVLDGETEVSAEAAWSR